MSRKQKIDMETVPQRLRDLSFRIRGMAFLIENQREYETVSPNIEEHFFGVGCILDELGREVRRIAEEVERGRNAGGNL